jgi:hypothetical protein
MPRPELALLEPRMISSDTAPGAGAYKVRTRHQSQDRTSARHSRAFDSLSLADQVIE